MMRLLKEMLVFLMAILRPLIEGPERVQAYVEYPYEPEMAIA